MSAIRQLWRASRDVSRYRAARWLFDFCRFSQTRVGVTRWLLGRALTARDVRLLMQSRPPVERWFTPPW